MRQWSVLGFLLLATAGLAGEPLAPGFTKDGRHFDRIVTIILENTNYKDAVKDPYLADLGRRGALFKKYYGVYHPSYPNYLALIAGNFFWTWLDTQKTIDAPTIADLLEEKGLTWKNYAEKYPGNCFLGNTSGDYARRHVPFLSFKAIQSNPARCARVVNATEFEADWAAGQLPNYSFYTPDNNDNGHDTDLPTLSAWLKRFLEPKLADTARMAGTMFFVTFDESHSILSNQVYAVAVGPAVRAGYEATRNEFNHFDHLKMVEDNFGLPTLGGGDEFATPMDEIFR